MSHSICVLVAALTRPEMSKSLEDSPTKILFATNLVECLLLALLGEFGCINIAKLAVDSKPVSPPPADDSHVVSDPLPLVQQLLNLINVGRRTPATHLSEAGIQKLICHSFAVLIEGSVRDRKFWEAAKQQAQFDRLLFSLLLDEHRRPIRKEISENIALVCTPTKLLQKAESNGDGQPASPTNPTQDNIVGTIWEAFVQTIPETPAYAHQSKEFFEVALLVFRSVSDKPSHDLRFGEYLEQWSTVMLSHETKEVCPVWVL